MYVSCKPSTCTCIHSAGVFKEIVQDCIRNGFGSYSKPLGQNDLLLKSKALKLGTHTKK